jgi:hypothetical protein
MLDVDPWYWISDTEGSDFSLEGIEETRIGMSSEGSYHDMGEFL